MTILDKITGAARRRVRDAEDQVSLQEMRETALKLPAVGPSFRDAIGKKGLSLICEVKRASPSRGVIAEDFPYAEIALSYESAGADAVSVLTEPEFFNGRDEYLKKISALVEIPTLRKDFIISEYQIYEARNLGAGAVLLICAILTDSELKHYISLAHTLGLSALTEAHSEDEIKRALYAGSEIIGVNNRDLRTFEVDLGVTERLRRFVPDGVLFVTESGISGPGDISALKNAEPDAVLIGEALMCAENRPALISALRGAAYW